MVRSMLVLRALPGRGRELVEVMTGGPGVPRIAVDGGGALAVELLASDDEPDRVVVTALWDDESHYQAWQSRQDRDGFREQVRALLREESTGTAYRVAAAAGAGPWRDA